MIFQLIGVILAIIGFLAHLGWLFIIGSSICLFLDIWCFLRGRLNPLFPLFLYVVGYIVIGNWTGILWGALIGNLVEWPLIILAGTGSSAFDKIKRLFTKQEK